MGINRRELLAGAGGLLLPALSGCGARRGGLPVVGFMQMANSATQDPSREGYAQGLADAGFVDGKSVRLLFKNAHGDTATLQLIAREFADTRVALIGTSSTPALQAAMKTTSEIPIVFTNLADPIAAGAGSDRDHRPNVTGVYNHFPIDEALELAHRIVPGARTFGTLYDPGDVFIEAFRTAARKKAAELKLEWVEVTATSSNEIIPGVQALQARGVEAILQLPCIVVYTGIDGLVKAAAAHQIPVVSVEPNHVKSGAVAALGSDFHHGGYEAGQVAARVLKGEKPAGIALRPAAKEVLRLNREAAARFGLVFPKEALQRAEPDPK